MGEIKRKVFPVQVDMMCPNCGIGLMRPGDTILPTYPPQFPHTCTECGFTESYYQSYPYIVWNADDEN